MRETEEQQRDNLRRLYAGMADEEIVKLARNPDSLTGMAQQIVDAEARNRGLALPTPQVETIDDVKIVTIRRYLNATEGLLARGRLESAGIPCFLADENLAQMGPYAFAVGGVRLQVRQSDVEAVLQVLDDQDGDRME